jgi:hypothetical protein
MLAASVLNAHNVDRTTLYRPVGDFTEHQA